jgi:hypothetical protein
MTIGGERMLDNNPSLSRSENQTPLQFESQNPHILESKSLQDLPINHPNVQQKKKRD